MMNVPNSCNEYSYVPPPLLPMVDQESSTQREQLGYNLEANNDIDMTVTNPLALLPSSNNSHHTTITHSTTHDILQFYPSSHYLSNPYTQFSGTSFQSYYPSPPTAQEYYFPTLVSPAEENMASFAATQLGLNLGYRTYFPSRGGHIFGHHPPRCQADGCKADLSNAKRYHRRHKVCEFHSKASVVVTAGGLHQRFCQQCSRFHLLDEFDDAKKSCRKRLADHNRRRRKLKPGDAADKRRSQSYKETTKDKAASSCKNTSIEEEEEQQVLGSVHLSKDDHQTMSPGEVVKEMGDHKGKASMQQQTHHHHQNHHDFSGDHKRKASMQQQTHHHHQNHHDFSFPSSSSSCCQAVSNDNASNMAQEHEPSLALHHHHHSNILQLGQAMFDLDFTN